MPLIVPPRIPAPPLAPPAAVATGRSQQKEATRSRVVTAARELFEEKGYEGTTIREIASRAGVSVGSVFTTFASKGDVLSEVMQQRLDALQAELDRVMPHVRGSTADRLRALCSVQFALEAPRSRLFLAHIAAAFDSTLTETAKPYGRTKDLLDIIRNCLEQGIGEDVDPAADLDAVVQLVLAAYAWTYRLAARDGMDIAAMTAVMDKQISLIADGFRVR